MTGVVEKIIPAGTIVHVRGIPVELSADTRALSHSSNWKDFSRWAPELVFKDAPAAIIGEHAVTAIRVYNGQLQVSYGNNNEWAAVPSIIDATEKVHSSHAHGYTLPGVHPVANSMITQLRATIEKLSNELDEQRAKYDAAVRQLGDTSALLLLSERRRAMQTSLTAATDEMAILRSDR